MVAEDDWAVNELLPVEVGSLGKPFGESPEPMGRGNALPMAPGGRIGCWPVRKVDVMVPFCVVMFANDPFRDSVGGDVAYAGPEAEGACPLF